MKKIFSLLLCGVVAGFIACEPVKNEPNGGSGSNDSTAIDSTLNDTTGVNSGDTTVVDTTVVTPSAVQFAVAVSNITSNGASVEVTATPADAYFFFDVLEAAYLTQMTKEEIAGLLLDTYLEDYLEYAEDYAAAGYNSFEEVYLVQGYDYWDYTGFNAETEYVVIAYSVNIANGNYTLGTVDASYTFTTLEATPVEPSNNTFTASATDSSFVITPSNEDTYYYTMYDKATVDYLGAQFILEYEISEWLTTGYLSYFLSSGVDGYTFCTYCDAPGTYQLLVAGCSADGQLTTAVSVFDFEVTAAMIAAGGCAEEGAAKPAKKQRFNGNISKDNGIKAFRIKDIARK